MKIPDDVRERLSTLITSEADNEDWIHRSDADKAALYSLWAKHDDIGRVLLEYMNLAEVHKYLKDTLIKNYVIKTMADPAMTFSILGITDNPVIQKIAVKPHGVTLMDGRVIAWSGAQEWKTTLIAVFERSHLSKTGVPFAAVLYNAVGKFADQKTQKSANDIGSRLGIEKILWIP